MEASFDMKKIIVNSFIFIGAFSLAMLFFGINGQAYIDPSLGTYLLQAVIALAVAVGGVVGIYFRKAKKKVQDKLGIDENSGKEVESDDLFESKDEAVADDEDKAE